MLLKKCIYCLYWTTTKNGIIGIIMSIIGIKMELANIKPIQKLPYMLGHSPKVSEVLFMHALAVQSLPSLFQKQFAK